MKHTPPRTHAIMVSHVPVLILRHYHACWKRFEGRSTSTLLRPGQFGRSGPNLPDARVDPKDGETRLIGHRHPAQPA